MRIKRKGFLGRLCLKKRYFLSLLVFVKITGIFSQQIDDIDVDIDINGPEPLVPHTTVNVPALISLGECGDCYCREIPNRMSVFYGNNCKYFPSNITVKTSVLKFRNTLVDIIKECDFQMLQNLTYMEIESNQFLTTIEPGCFKNMNKLTNLSICFNENLQVLDDKVFEGLINLREIYLRNNGFTKILDITRSLSIKYVPNLLMLNINRNIIKEINKDEFHPMEGTGLTSLNMILCEIEYIHSEALKPLKKLKALRVGENLLTVRALAELMNTSINYGIPLEILNLYDLGFRVTPPKILLEVIANSSIKYLNLGRNRFEHLNDKSFITMPFLETLVLRDVVTVDISQDCFKGITNLKQLILSQNHLTSIPKGVLMSTLRVLDMSSNSYTVDTPFEIRANIFQDMNNLQQLVLSHNFIEVLNPSTFNGLTNLIILELNNANLNTIYPESFATLTNLRRLNLENNHIGKEVILIPELFKGLSKLNVLLLGGCRIENLTITPSLFKYTPRLYYLGLQRNGLHTISSFQFFPIPSLRIIDLSDNYLTPWNEMLFYKQTLELLIADQNKLTYITKPMLEDFANLDSWRLDGNPFTCDCSWNLVLTWLRNNMNISKAPSNDNFIASCVAPDKWRRVSVTQYLHYLKNHTYECAYKQLQNKVILISVLTFFMIFITCITLVCFYYRWNIRYWIFLAGTEIKRRRKQFQLRPKLAITNCERKYDAFVSYSSEDKYFVDKLVDELENYYPYLKLCVYDRDFQIGTVISEVVMHNIDQSQRIILIVSDSFAKSQWCRWEMHLAECHQLQDNCEDGLLIIRLHKLNKKFMSPFLKYLMKSRIFLEWENDVQKEKLFWNKLRTTLCSPSCG